MADAAILIFSKMKSIDPGNQMGHVIALFICFSRWRVHFWSYFKVLRWKSRWKGLIFNIVDGMNHTWLLLGTLFRNILDFIMVICFIILIFSIILLFDTVVRHFSLNYFIWYLYRLGKPSICFTTNGIRPALDCDIIGGALLQSRH